MLIVPNVIQNLSFSTTLENDPNIPTYSDDSTYSVGYVVIYGNYVYSSLADDNKGNVPSENPLKWYQERPTNKWAMFDSFNDTQSVDNETITITVDAQFIEYFAMFGLYAETVYVKVEDANGDIVFEKTYDTVQYNISDWWELIYDDGVPQKKLIDKIYPYEEQKITIEIRPLDGVAKCGNLIMGLSKYTGCTLTDAKISVRSTTVKDRRTDGRIIAKKGMAYDRIIVPVIVDTAMMDMVVDMFRDIDGVSTLFVADDRDNDSVKSLSVFGFFKDFEMDFGFNKSRYTIEIEGVG